MVHVSLSLMFERAVKMASRMCTGADAIDVFVQEQAPCPWLRRTGSGIGMLTRKGPRAPCLARGWCASAAAMEQSALECSGTFHQSRFSSSDVRVAPRRLPAPVPPWARRSTCMHAGRPCSRWAAWGGRARCRGVAWRGRLWAGPAGGGGCTPGRRSGRRGPRRAWRSATATATACGRQDPGSSCPCAAARCLPYPATGQGQLLTGAGARLWDGWIAPSSARVAAVADRPSYGRCRGRRHAAALGLTPPPSPPSADPTRCWPRRSSHHGHRVGLRDQPGHPHPAHAARPAAGARRDQRRPHAAADLDPARLQVRLDPRPQGRPREPVRPRARARAPSARSC